MSITQHSIQLLKQQNGALRVAAIQLVNYSTSQTKVYNLSQLKRGTGGRSSFNGIVATVFGASGFIGRYICNRLGKTGTQLIIPYRADFYEVADLKCVGDLGQVLFHPYYLKDEESIKTAMKYSNVVINLVGRDWETRNFSFNDVHVEGARRLARAAREAGVERFIHFSALNATPNPKPHMIKKGSGFLKSKYFGEVAVLEEFPTATIIRPSDIYGQEDRFITYYAHFWRRLIQTMPIWKKGEHTIKQPVFVSDVAQGVLNAIRDPDTAGKIYQAVGPNRYLLSDLVDWFFRIMKRDYETTGYYRYDARYDPTFYLKVFLTEKLCPSHKVADLHWERVERECVTDSVENHLPTLEDLGVTLTHMEDQVPWELRPRQVTIYVDRDLADFGSRPEPPPIVEKAF